MPTQKTLYSVASQREREKQRGEKREGFSWKYFMAITHLHLIYFLKEAKKRKNVVRLATTSSMLIFLHFPTCTACRPLKYTLRSCFKKLEANIKILYQESFLSTALINCVDIISVVIWYLCSVVEHRREKVSAKGQSHSPELVRFSLPFFPSKFVFLGVYISVLFPPPPFSFEMCNPAISLQRNREKKNHGIRSFSRYCSWSFFLDFGGGKDWIFMCSVLSKVWNYVSLTCVWCEFRV